MASAPFSTAALAQSQEPAGANSSGAEGATGAIAGEEERFDAVLIEAKK
jgi:hypothetical protein